MSFRGRIHNGVIVLPPEIRLPEGTEVKVEPLEQIKRWPENFFDSIRITDPNFKRPEQGQLPPVKIL